MPFKKHRAKDGKLRETEIVLEGGGLHCMHADGYRSASKPFTVGAWIMVV